MTVSWKNVLRLYGVYTKSYRLITKGKFRNYRERRWLSYTAYALLFLLGAGFGSLMAVGIVSLGSDSMPEIRDAAAAIFVSLPILTVLYTLYFTQMGQIQRMGANVAVQPIYWFPLTWEEHTLASILMSMYAPMSINIMVIPAILIPAFAIGMLPLGLLTVVTLLVGMAMAGATAEVLKGVQIRIIETLSKRAGRLTVWIRFVATLLIFTLVYAFYFGMNRTDVIGMVQSLSDGIMLGWFIPYLWPGIVLYEVYRGAWPGAAVFTFAVAGFCWVLYRVAVRFNERFALRDTMAVHITGGAYVPKRGLLQRIGISPAVAAIMRKDLRSYTRRQELMYVFITPIIVVISTLMPSMAGGRDLGSITFFPFFSLALEPAVVLAAFLACSIVGSEGGQRWFLFMSPLTPRSFVRAKYLSCALASGAAGIASVAVASLIFSSTPYWIATGLVESLLLAFAIAMVALAFGIRGADFREVTPRRQMIRARWMLACMAVCIPAALIIALPVMAYGAADMIGDVAPGVLPSPLSHGYLFAAWAISGLFALAIGGLFYFLAVRSAEGLFKSMDT